MGKEIIIVTISLGNDGAERILTELARQWHHDGHKITVIQTSPNRYGTEYALPEGIEQIQIHTTSSNKIIRFLQEIKALIDNDYPGYMVWLASGDPNDIEKIKNGF